MAKNDKRPNVLLTTVPNGYSLTVDKKEYMAFDVESMLAQVFTHIALHENDYLEANYVKSLFEVAGAWPDHKDAYIAVAEQMAIVKEQQKTIITSTSVLVTSERRKMMWKQSSGKPLNRWRNIPTGWKTSHAIW